MGVLFLISIVVIYILLGILYENFIHPITVLTTLPPTILGGLLSLVIFQMPLSLYAFVGLIMLLGIVLKNGIMMIDFANEIKIHHPEKSPKESIHEAACLRFRPILMTTLSTFMGVLPVAIGIGGFSAKGRMPLGVAIVGGLVVSQVMTLFITPALYTYLEGFQRWVQKRSAFFRSDPEAEHDIKHDEE